MLRLRGLIGTPVVRGDEALGYVERAVLTEGATRLQGVIVRRGLGMAKWFPRARIEVVGHSCVVVSGEPERPPKNADRELGCCYTDRCVGLVTDALLYEDSLRVCALEVSEGPLFSLAGRKRYVSEYRVRPGGKGAPREVIAARLTQDVEERRRTHESDQDGDDGRDRLRARRGHDDDARQPEAAQGNAQEGRSSQADDVKVKE